MRVAVIGCGLIGRKRAKALPNSVEIVGCVDSEESVAQEFAEQFDTQVFATPEDLLKAKKLDFVIVATQHRSLASLSLQVLSSGRHVFVEKPGAMDYQSLKAICEVARLKNLRIHVGYNHPYHPAIRAAIEFFKQGAIGEIMFLRAQYGHGGRLGYENEWRADKSKSGGGELIDQGTHLIDLAMHFLGDVKLDYAATPNYYWNTQLEDNAFISLKNHAGNIAFLQASCTEWKNKFSLEIYGNLGKLDISGLGGSYGKETLTFHKMLPRMGPPLSENWEFSEPDNSWALEINEFIEDLNTGSRKSDNVESSLQILRLVDEIYLRNSR